VNRLWLTGFMGTGKTTVGRLLADRFGVCFVDMDEEIERRSGHTVSDLFATQGEGAFRLLETMLLRELAGSEARVVATGGGALLSDVNLQLVPADDTVICLTCRAEQLAERLIGVSDRPLLSGGGRERIRELLEARASAYARFEQVDTTLHTPEDIAAEIGRRCELGQIAELDFEDRRYSRLVIERGGIARADSLLCRANLVGELVLVTDETVESLGLADQFQNRIELDGRTVHRVTIPSGEDQKNLATLEMLYRFGLERELDRRAVVIGLGGGVIGDLAGTFAATYLRGLHLVLIPTTLLAQVDASIGGKVAVDLQTVKNMVGSFYPADLVIIDPDVLDSLAPAAVSDGLAEVVKIALVRSPRLVDALEDLREPLDVIRDTALIREAARQKILVVERDPREHGERELLNYGHTIGHAVEAASEYRLSHGQAIAVGMVAETRLAEVAGWCAPGVLGKLEALLSKFGLPQSAPGLDPEIVFGHLREDKKRKGKQIRFVVPTTIGDWGAVVVTESQARDAVSFALSGDETA
jgi:3-dehydroquinate synthase